MRAEGLDLCKVWQPVQHKLLKCSPRNSPLTLALGHQAHKVTLADLLIPLEQNMLLDTFVSMAFFQDVSRKNSPRHFLTADFIAPFHSRVFGC